MNNSSGVLGIDDIEPLLGHSAVISRISSAYQLQTLIWIPSNKQATDIGLWIIDAINTHTHRKRERKIGRENGKGNGKNMKIAMYKYTFQILLGQFVWILYTYV